MEGNKLWEEMVVKTRKMVQEKYKMLYGSLDFGAYIHAENYFVSYIFETTNELNDAKKRGLLDDINNYHKNVMEQNGYPLEAIKDCTFAAQEDCDKKYNGNWYYYYK